MAVTRIAYLFDPLCGWCYGASAALEKVVAQPDIVLEYIPTGLFAGEGARPMDEEFAAYAWANDQRISRLTGQPFSEDYRRNVLGDRMRLFDSGPATLALTAVALTAPDQEFEALRAIQKARYLQGCDNTDVSVLSDVLHALKLHQAADRLVAPNDELIAAYRMRITTARGLMHQFGIDGVPALIAGVGDNRRVVPASPLFGSMEVLLAGLKAA